MEKKTEYKYPENMGCEYLGVEKTGGASLGCWAKALLVISNDCKDSHKMNEIEEAIIKKARAAGCKEILKLE